MNTNMKRILCVGESDSSGGAGIQADIKTITALGGYAATALTALTVQNSQGVTGLNFIDGDFVYAQMKSMVDDLGVDAFKVGVIGQDYAVNRVGDLLDETLSERIKVIIDPAIATRSGEAMVDEQTLATIKRRLLVRADLITPNKREAELLTGMTIRDLDDMRHATEMMRTLGAAAVLLKAGTIDSDYTVDLLAHDGGEYIFKSKVVKTKHTHGAGATLSSAITYFMADGDDVQAACQKGIDYLNHAIYTAPGFGKAVGPIHHMHGQSSLLSTSEDDILIAL